MTHNAIQVQITLSLLFHILAKKKHLLIGALGGKKGIELETDFILLIDGYRPEAEPLIQHRPRSNVFGDLGYQVVETG